MIRAFFRKLVSIALLCGIALTAYGIGTGRIVSPVRTEQTSLDRMTVYFGDHGITVDLDAWRNVGNELCEMGDEIRRAFPAWLQKTVRLIGQAATDFLASCGLHVKKDPVPTFGVTNSTPTVFTKRCGYDRIF